MKHAWREAEKKTEQRLSKASPDLTSLEDLESGLPHAVQEELETAFLRRHSWRASDPRRLDPTAFSAACAETPSVFKVSKVRTRIQTSLADPWKRRRISQHVSLTLVSELPEETPISGIMDFFGKLHVLALSWAVAGNTAEHWKGSDKLFAHWSELSDYIEGLQERVLEMRGQHSEASLLAYVCVVEEEFRSRAVELARTPGAPTPWSAALL